jgi:two-component system CheB/CheR fusion protein
MPPVRPDSAKAVTPRSPASARSRAPDAQFPVVAIGASAGGLETFRRLLDALPATTGMAFILVQHLDPTHDSLLVELLAEHTALTVLEAGDGMSIECEHLYVIPPGAYLAVDAGVLHLSKPRGGPSVRLPSISCCGRSPTLMARGPFVSCCREPAPTEALG